LARERRRITVGQIVRIVKNDDTETDMLSDDAGSALAQTVVRPLCKQIQDDVMTQLDGVTLDDLCDKAYLAGIQSEGRSNLDFSI
jgi:DNA-binding IscR family transcriptional regulator